jgi:predicted ferric reductase
MAAEPKPRRFRAIHLLLLVPYVAMLWVPSYNRVEPALAGIPFFYWYQMLWIVLGVAVLIPVYFADERSGK